MPSFLIKRGGIWAGGKLLTEGDTVELSEKDRDIIDPEHTTLQSAKDAKHEAEKLAAESKAAAEKAKQLAEAESKAAAEKKSKDGAK